MTRICNSCDKEYQSKSAKSRYCSEACKQSAKRNRTVSPSTVSRHDKSDKSDTIDDTIATPLSKTDQLFQDDAVKRNLGEHWLAFSPITRQPECVVRSCGKKFKTQLPLLRYCSPECRSLDLGGK